MPKMNLAIPHTLGKEEAAERLKGRLAHLKEQHQEKTSGMTEEWVDNVLNFAFTAMGFKVKGKMAVEDDKVNIEGDLPFAAMMFKGKIEKEVSSQLTRWLA